MYFIGEISEIESGFAEIQKNSEPHASTEDITVEILKGFEGLNISGEGHSYKITYGEKSDFFRALAILTGKLRQGEISVNISETRQFKSCGVMIDCSRNAILKPEAFKDIIRKMASMGLNTVMLYTEDTYKIDEYPYFGYMRGAYTKEELKDLDMYAGALGIELIPCIQTLGHLYMALRWPFADNIKDTGDILLADELETYKFIEAMLKTCRECFSTNKIHIGMDEAHAVGLGKHLDIHGFQNRFDILSRHLSKVAEIADTLGFKPMMWSDMFFRLASQTGDYYDVNAVIPADLSDKIPENVSQVYWDYYHEDLDTYRSMVQKHKELKRNVIFAGGIWTWVGMGIDYSRTFRCSHAALKVCREEGITDVFATTWGDDGAEVNIYSALLGMQLYAEYAYHDDVSKEHLREQFMLCTGYSMDAFLALEIDNFPAQWCYSEEGALTVSKQILYQDLLLGFFDKNFEGLDIAGHYKNRLDTLQSIKMPEKLEMLFGYYRQLLSILIDKYDMGLRITEMYKKRDIPAIIELIRELEMLYKNIEMLYKKFRLLWLKTYKPQGLERIDLRFGGLLARIKVAEERMSAFANGDIERIEELDEPRLMAGGDHVKHGKSLLFAQTYHAIAIPAF